MKRFAVVALVLFSGCFLRNLYATDWPQPVERHRVTTADGWSLDLEHVRPQKQTHPRPVIVMHGIIANGRNCDLDEKHSIARYLASQGFDVWVPSLRNVGGSEHRSFIATPDEQEDFDAYVTQDLPAIIGYVRAHAGNSEVDWIGHSMGGMVAYAYLSRGGTGIARIVTLGSPVKMRWSGRVEEAVREFEGIAKLASFAPIRTSSLVTLPIQGSVNGPIERMLLNFENTTPETWRAYVSVGVDDLPGPLVQQFAGWVERDAFESRDRKVDYLGGLRNVRIPALVVAGKVDGIAPPWVVKPAFEMLGSPEKRWILLSEANGQSADYNHMDMLLGERAAQDVWGRVAAFLAH